MTLFSSDWHQDIVTCTSASSSTSSRCRLKLHIHGHKSKSNPSNDYSNFIEFNLISRLTIMTSMMLLSVSNQIIFCDSYTLKKYSRQHRVTVTTTSVSMVETGNPENKFSKELYTTSPTSSSKSSSNAVMKQHYPKTIDSSGWIFNKFPAKLHCSKCGLCETSFVQNVTNACPFINNNNHLGMGQLHSLEVLVHGRTRHIINNNDTVQEIDNYSKNVNNNENSSNSNNQRMSWGTKPSISISKSSLTTTETVAVLNHNQNNTADEMRFGVMYNESIQLVRGISMPHAQWTGVVTSIAVAMLETNQVDAVVCIASSASSAKNHNDVNDSNNITSITSNSSSSSSWNTPEPIIARTVTDVLRGRGVKPCLAPSLRILDEIRNDPSIQRLLFCGVGCAVQAFRVIQNDLNLDQVYVLGTNCVDNSPSPEAAQNFIETGFQLDSTVGTRNDPSTTGRTSCNEQKTNTILGYEFMQDYRVHVKTSNSYITKPYFSLPRSIAEQSIAKSCLTCMDYTNGLADVVVGYMGAPLRNGQRMDESYQTLTVRNERGRCMIEAALKTGRIQIGPTATGGGGTYEPLVINTVQNDAHVMKMIDPTINYNEKDGTTGMPVWIGEILAYVLRTTGPTGINFARYSIDYHILRNYLYILSIEDMDDGEEPKLPLYAETIVNSYKVKYASFQNLCTTIIAQRKKERKT